MKMRVDTRLPVILTLVLGLSVACVQQEQPAIYTIGSGISSGIYADAGSALARIVNKNAASNGFRLENELSDGSTANINAVIAGEIQFGLAQADDRSKAVQGAGDWQGSGPQGKLRSVLSIYAEAVTIIAGADSGIRSIGDLRDHRVDIGLRGSGARQNAVDALEAAGIDWRNRITVPERKGAGFIFPRRPACSTAVRATGPRRCGIM